MADVKRYQELAETCFVAGNLAGAKQWARWAHDRDPSSPGLAQALAAYEVHANAATKKILPAGTPDWYAVLGVPPPPRGWDAGYHETIKKQYRRLCVLVHPDKNRSAAADGAFKLVQKAWTLLSARHPPQPTAAAPASRPAAGMPAAEASASRPAAPTPAAGRYASDSEASSWTRGAPRGCRASGSRASTRTGARSVPPPPPRPVPAYGGGERRRSCAHCGASTVGHGSYKMRCTSCGRGGTAEEDEEEVERRAEAAAERRADEAAFEDFFVL